MAFKAANQYWENSTFNEGINGGIAVRGQELPSRLDGIQLNSRVITTSISNKLLQVCSGQVPIKVIFI
jgi:hypothetical protein